MGFSLSWAWGGGAATRGFMGVTAYQRWWLGDTQSDVEQFLKEEFAESGKTIHKLLWVGAALFFLRGTLELLTPIHYWNDFVVRAIGTGWLVGLCAFYSAITKMVHKSAVYGVYLTTFVSLVGYLGLQHNFHIGYLAVPIVLCLAFGVLTWPSLHGIYWPILAVVVPCATMLVLIHATTIDKTVYAFYLMVGAFFAIMVRRSRMRTAFTLFVFRQKLHNQTTHDPLTGLLNRTGWKEQSSELYSKCTAAGQPLMVAFIDIDHFKKVNDVHGHNVGDEVITTTAQKIVETFPSSSLVARFGGEEFIAAVPNMTPEQSVRLAEYVRTNIEQIHHPVPITVSIGVSVTRGEKGISETMHAADMFLLRAKEQGRNRTCLDTGLA